MNINYKEENERLLRQIKKLEKGSEEYNKLADKIIKTNIKFITKIASDNRYNLSLDDAMQEAYMSTLKVIDYYDKSKGEFTTLLGVVISKDLINKNDEYSIIKQQYNYTCAIFRAVRRLSEQGIYDATIKQISKESGLKEEIVEKYLQTREISSLDYIDEIYMNKTGKSIYDLIPDDGANPDPIREEEFAKIDKALEYLTTEDKLLIHLFYISGKKLEEIAETYGCTRQNVDLKLQRAVKRIKLLVSDNGLQAIDNIKKLRAYASLPQNESKNAIDLIEDCGLTSRDLYFMYMAYKTKTKATNKLLMLDFVNEGNLYLNGLKPKRQSAFVYAYLLEDTNNKRITDKDLKNMHLDTYLDSVTNIEYGLEQ